MSTVTGYVKKQKQNFIPAQKCFDSTREFYRFLHRGWSQDFLGEIIQFHRKWCGINKVVDFKDFLRPNKEIKYFSRTLTEFQDLLRRPLKFSRLYEPCTFILLEDFDCNSFAHEHIVLIELPLRENKLLGSQRQIASLVLGIHEFHHSYFQTNKKF